MTDATTPSLTNPNPKREDERVEKAERTLEHEIWEAIRTHSSPTMSPSDKTGWTSVHGGQSGVIVWERDGKPYVIAEIMRIIRREAASARPSPGDPVRAALEALVKSLDDLIAESEGVAGLHRNGDVATWEELISGGRFEEWLSSLDAARAALSVSTPTGEGDARRHPWCQPGDDAKRRWLVYFEDTEKGFSVFEDEVEAREFFDKADGGGWNCYLFSAAPRQSAAPTSPSKSSGDVL